MGFGLNRVWAIVLMAAAAGGAESAGANSLILSTAQDEIIDGQLFLDGDLFSVDENPGSATLFLSEAIFPEDEDVDAAALLRDGTILLSTAQQSQIGGLIFQDGDLVAYDPATGEASEWLEEKEFVADLDIDAAHVLGNGHVLFSLRDDTILFPFLPEETLYLDGDIIEYDPVAGATSLYLSEEIFTWDVDNDGDGVPDFDSPDIDGLSMLANGNLLLTVRSDGMIGEATYSDGEIIEYDPETGDSSLYLFIWDRSDTDLDVNAVATPLPEPGQFLLRVTGLVAVALLYRLRRSGLR